MAAPRPKIKNPPDGGQSSLHRRVVDELRQLILARRFKPGERLVEERLAEELGVSRNPVREAIRVLAAEGLVEVSANRGASVTTMSAQEARETIELRALLEGHNARLATRRQDKEVIKRIEAVLTKGSLAVANGRFEQLGDLNQKFHAELAAASQNTVLGDVLKRLRDRTAMLFSTDDPDYQERTWNEHAAILRAIIDGDERRAASLAAEHVMHAGSDYLLALDLQMPWDAAAPEHARRTEIAPPRTRTPRKSAA
ncbi:DNA-binding transcriptional regulator, GntR family [Enhydrobacter aerosaccus]|uniref:DNA-binding transcriptional regulator, GntR family n=1 Tax=Enhydrobacter aerosaccus TaxID=225324 RepID=A0A1T4T373_9HYPH|nr:GntR family transcriptional regulator [Enhydrobacter aerosaccus]SKA34847.1 DNA-binding transcriptional regulator, GntR family [Enhydrobacter aerosaccus]